MTAPGTLYIVATPIGNLEDITLRAIEVLRSVDLVAAEDTRHSKILMQRIQATTPLIAYHDFSSDQAIQKILHDLGDGKSIALISDAGTPLISDPGYRLVSLARDHGVPVIPIPGASAVTAALSVSGLPTDRFAFEGFLPHKQAARQARLQELKQEIRSLVFYESTHRIQSSIEDLQLVFGADRMLFIGRELTKKFESHFRGTVADSLQWLRQDENASKGEFVLVVSGCDPAVQQEQNLHTAVQLVARLRQHVPMKTAVALASEITGAKKNALYQLVLEQDARDSLSQT